MTCPDRREALLDLSLGLLPPAEARALERHAAGCPACGEELRSLRAARGVMAALPVEPAPVHGEALLLAAARQAAEASLRRRPAWRRPWLAGGTLGLAGAAALVLVLVQSRGEPRLADGPQPTEATQAAAPAAEVVATPAAKAAARIDLLAEAPPAPAPEPKREVAEADQAPTRRTAGAGAMAANESGRRAKQAAAPPPAPAAPAAATTAEARVAPKRAEAGITAAAPSVAGEVAQGALVPALAPASAAKPARAAADGPQRTTGAEDRGAAVGEAPSPALAAPRAVPAASRATTAAVRECRMEARRSLERDEAGRVVARHRSGSYPAAAGADLPLTVDERYGPDGRLRTARVRIGDRTITVSEDDVAAGRLEPWPGVLLARDAAEAERAPPRCEP